MPYQRPELQTIVDRMRGDFDASLGLAQRLRRGMLDVLGKVWGGAVHGLYGYGDWIARQILPWSADEENLARHAAWWNIIRKEATPARGQATFFGENGAVLPAGAAMAMGGVMLKATTAGTVDNGAVTVDVEALEPGISGNAPAGVAISLTSPVAGVLPDGVVGQGGLTGGGEAEDDASLLERLKYRVQQPPAGGARTDYVNWALTRNEHGVDVTRAWCYPREMGEGTVTVRFMTDGVGDGIPSAQAVADVASYIETVRPVTAEVFVVAPVPVLLTVRIAGLTPATVAARSAVEAELADLIRRESKPGGTILISHIREAISIAAGEHDHELQSPTANVTHDKGHICVFGGVQWV